MKESKSLNLLLITIVTLYLSCSSRKLSIENSQKQPEMTTSNYLKLTDDFFDHYDSVKLYKDADLFHLKGIEELNKDSLSYPFMAFKYKKDTIELESFLNKNETRKWKINKTNGLFHTEFKFHEKGDRFVMLLFPGNGKFIWIYTINKRFNLTASQIDPHLIIYYSASNAKELKSESFRYFQIGFSLFVEDVLNVKEDKLNNCYADYLENIENIKDGKLYRTKHYSVDLISKKIEANDKKLFLEEEVFGYPSFFYWFMHKLPELKQNIY